METFNTLVGIGTLIAQILGGALLLLVIFKKRLTENAWFQKLQKWALPMAFVAVLLATLGSLAYSNVIGFEPCLLCWWQRIFLYPLVILLFVAMTDTFEKIHRYVLPLSIIGISISAYHYIVQRFQLESVSCDALGQSPSCSGFYVFEMGYITIPLMCFTIFGLVILLMILKKK